MALRGWTGNKIPTLPAHGLSGPSGQWALKVSELLLKVIANQIIIIGELSDLRRKKGRS